MTDYHEDELFEQAVSVVRETGRASVCAIQRRLRIGFVRASLMIEDMERKGIVERLEPDGAYFVKPNASGDGRP